MKYVLILLFLTGLNLTITAQPADTLYFGWYNVENLFDTFDNPNAYNQKGGDDEYTIPENGWSAERYDLKLQNLASVINKMNGGKGPDVLGFCELENQNVL